MFKFIQNFKTKYSKVPDLETFTSKFPEFEMDNSPENMGFYCDDLRNKVKHNHIVDGLEKVGEELEDMNTDEAYDVIKKLVRLIESDIVLGDTKKINEDVIDRWNKYLERRNLGGIIGIPTGIEAFDRMTGGLGKTDLITILGFTGIGKTWALIIIGVALAKSGTRILFVTREMNPDQVMKRTDAVWCGISYNDFNRGQLSQKDETKYQDYLSKIQEHEDNFIVELSTGGVTNIAALIDKHEPEVVLVDGAYLMSDDEDDDDWRGIMKVWRGMKQIALTKKVPFITTSQSKESEKVSLGKISFSKALANECLEGNQFILTDKGYFKIKSLVENEFNVFDGDNIKKAVCFPTGKKQVTKIIYRGKEFICSPKHLIGVYDNCAEKFSWKEASSIDPLNDFILEYDEPFHEGKFLLPFPANLRGIKEIKVPNFKFIPVTKVENSMEEIEMFDIKVFDEDKSIIVNNILNHNCDIVIALEQDKEMFAMKDVMWKPLKLRDAEMGGYFVTKWDWNNMDYHTVIFEGRHLDKPSKEEIADVQDIGD
jgi:KaiC/GvpD/RAD55 family RecA-like ATPase